MTQQQIEIDAAQKMGMLKMITPEEYLELFAEGVCPRFCGFDMLEMVHGYERGLAMGTAWLSDQKTGAIDVAFQLLQMEKTLNDAGVIATTRLLNAPVLAMDMNNPTAGIMQRMVMPAENASEIATAALAGASAICEVVVEQQIESMQSVCKLLTGWLDTMTKARTAKAPAMH